MLAILAAAQTNSAPFETGNCLADCFNNQTANPDFFYCSSSLTMGTCCPPGSADPACIDSATVSCSQNYTATNENAKYAFCPRKT